MRPNGSRGDSAPRASLHTSETRGPRAVHALGRVLAKVDALFDRAYGSHFNPLYQSGTLATALLAVVIATGLYLLFFYRLSAPYESIVDISGQFLVGRWIRSLHRYASDAAMVAVTVHLIRMAAEGRSWGPRFLAWVSGVLMMGVLLFSGFTGYILVWDRFGQAVAVSGAQLVDQLGVFAVPLGRSFNGAAPIPSSFFFMNLFLHVALPLAAIAALWIHTSRLARSVWLPLKKMFVVTITALFVLSAFWPAPLALRADPLSIAGEFPIDWYYGAWLELVWRLGPALTLGAWAAGFLFLMSIPAWWKPAANVRPAPSIHDQLKCKGCRQCSLDCPFEAIAMVPRTAGTGSELVAQVDPALCVSCGICAGSCTQLAIGPAGRSGREQLVRLRELVSKAEARGPEGMALLYCANNRGAAVEAERLSSLGFRVVPCGVVCIGGVHSGVVTALLHYFQGVFLWGCPVRECQAREGYEVTAARLFQDQSPGLPARIDRKRIALHAAAAAESEQLEFELRELAHALGVAGAARGGRSFKSILGRRAALGAVITVVTLAALWIGSRYPGGLVSSKAVLRLSWRLPGQVVETCRDRSPEELAKLPAHMRVPRLCKAQALSYELAVTIDGVQRPRETFAPKGLRGDRPLIVGDELALTPGDHDITVAFVPTVAAREAQRLELAFKAGFTAGRAILVTYDASVGRLVLRQ